MHIAEERISWNDDSRPASLMATFYIPPEPRASVLFPAAMGATQKYYSKFAQWLAQQGFLCATFDYRGMGQSAPRSLRDCDVNISDWARGDCQAMIGALKSRLPNRSLFVVGHSLGGQIVGMIPNRQLIDGVAIVASGSGYWRDISASMRGSSALLWYVLAPTLTPLFGYFPGKLVRAVGNLPRGVVEQWRRWCLHPDYMIGVEHAQLRADYAALAIPMLSLSFTDDELMSAACTEKLLGFYSGASQRNVRLAPREVGATKIGHFGFFRRAFIDTLWPLIPRWLEQQL